MFFIFATPKTQITNVNASTTRKMIDDTNIIVAMIHKKRWAAKNINTMHKTIRRHSQIEGNGTY
jgi:hypothetical protein